MSNDNPKHRHDVGHPEHGPRSTEIATKGIQLALGLAVLGTLILCVYLVAVRAGSL